MNIILSREGKTKKWLADQWGISQPSITQKFKEDNWKESMKLLQYKKQEIVLVWVLGQQDIMPSQKGSFRLVDKETGETRDLELTADVLKNYQKALESYEADIREFCKKRGIIFVKAVEDMPLLKVLYNMLICY